VRTVFFELVEGFRIAASAIWANKLRSVLTTLGIIIGIASVTLMATIINGVDQQFEKSLSSLGTDVLYVDDRPWGFNTGDWWKYINRPPIQASLAETIRERSRYAERVAPLVSTRRSVTYQDRDVDGVNVEASTPEYGIVRNVELSEGRFYTASDQRGARNVCVIGVDIADELFPVATPLGKRIRIGGYPCRVIGVHAREGEGLFGGNQSPDMRVMMPFSTFEKFFGLSRWRDVTVMVQVGSTRMMKTAEDELTGIIRTARQVEPGGDNNFAINAQEEIRSTFAPVKLTIYGVGLFLTALALLVGGIGVMNIMFVSVRERTKEIGIRKAVGAKKRTIMLQFLIESVIVCLIGGLIGVGLSALLAMAVNAAGFTAVLPMETVGIAFGICVGVGVLFGIAPAWQGATAEPIEALRYE
jgi:putative ABC transport system permease protein